MTLPASPPIKASDINVELGRAAGAAFDINGASERALAGVPSGQIRFSDFLGKSTLSAGYVEFDALSDGGATWSGTVNIGAASAQRRVVLVVNWGEGSSHIPLGSATIGGVAATIHRQGGHSGGVTGLGVAIISAIIPTGTTANVVLNYGSVSISAVRVGVWRLQAYNTIVATGADEASGTTANLSVSIATVNNGFVIAGHTGSTNTHTFGVSWTNVTERYDIDNGVRESGADASVSVGTLNVSSTQGVHTNSGVDLVVVSFGP